MEMPMKAVGGCLGTDDEGITEIIIHNGPCFRPDSTLTAHDRATTQINNRETGLKLHAKRIALGGLGGKEEQNTSSLQKQQ